MRKIILPILLLLVGFGAFKLLSSFHKEPQRKAKTERILKLPVHSVRFDTQKPMVHAMGRIHAFDEVNLVAEVSGKILNSSFKLRSGINFRKGAIIAQIDSRNAQNLARIQNSSLLSGLAEMLPDLQTDLPDAYEKWNAFFQKLSPDFLPEFPNWESDKEKMFLTRFRIFSLYYAAKNQQIMLSKYTIRAPFTGTIVSSRVSPGDLAGPGTPIAVLARTDQYELLLPIPQDEAKLLKTGAKISIRLSESGDSLTGKLTGISQVLNIQNASVEARILLHSHKKNILNGAYAEVQIPAGKPIHSAKVPRLALVGDTAVLTVQLKNSSDSLGILKLKPVSVIHRDPTYAYITDGLDSNDLVITEALQDVMPGIKVIAVKSGLE